MSEKRIKEAPTPLRGYQKGEARGLNQPPAHLSDAAKALWLQLLPQLKELGFWKRTDALALELFCATYVQWRELAYWLRENPAVTTNKDGEPVVDPHFEACMGLADSCLEMMRELGLTPLSRAKIASHV